MDEGAIFVGTCLAAAIASILMGLYANWPVGLAPGMGLNAFFTFTVVGQMGYSWEIALGAVFLAGILFFIMSITKLRRWMIDSIPLNLRIAMGSGVGLFIGFIGLKSGGIIISNDVTYLSLGDFKNYETLLASFGFLLISILAIRRIPGAIIIGILSTTLIALMIGLVQYNGVVDYPPQLAPTLMKLDILGALDLAMISIIMSFLFVNLFGCAPVTSYVESSAGVEAGGRTGLTAVVVGIFFIIAIFFSPLASMVPAYATSGALIYVSILMLGGMERLNWSKTTDLLPALIIIVMIPLTFSIADGIALGFLSYIALKIGSGEFNKISYGAWFLTLIFLSKFIFL